MFRTVSACVLAALLAPAAALSAEGPEVCILQATESLTAPRKPNIFSMNMDCGSEPGMEQESAMATVNSMSNTADAVSFALGLGYEVEDSTTMVSYTGKAIITTYLLIKGDETVRASGGSMMESGLLDLPEADDLEDMLPEAEESDTMMDEASEEEASEEEDAMKVEDAEGSSDDELDF